MSKLNIIIIAIAGLASLQIGAYGFGKNRGKVEGCQISYRDLYRKLDMKVIDEDDLFKFCKETVK